MQPAAYALFVCGVFLLAGGVKGVIGMGLPTISVGLLGLMMTPAQAAALMVVPSLVTNAWQGLAGPRLWRLLRRFWALQLALCAGTWLSATAGSGGGSDVASIALGLALAIYAACGLAAFQLRVSPKAEAWLSPIVGALTGLISGVTGIFVMPAVPYLQAVLTDRDELVQALGLTFLIGTLAIALSLASIGAFGISLATHSVLALLPALAGMAAGGFVRRRISVRTFRLCFFAGTLLLGLHLALRPFL